MSDYIKREDAYQAVADNNYSDGITLKRYDAILESIGNIPPADVRENVHGHVIVTKIIGVNFCSVCKGFINNMNHLFCPRCGAILDEEDEVLNGCDDS